jgi:hypothetical protein
VVDIYSRNKAAEEEQKKRRLRESGGELLRDVELQL